MQIEFFREVVSPMLDRLDSETWHVRAREALHLAEISPLTLRILEKFAFMRERFTDPRLSVVMGGIEFDNPVVVGAGWDKAGRAVEGLHTLGFSGVEVGSVLALPQPGNEKPRQFMIGPGVALNRLGFNSPGVDEVARNLERYRNSGIPIGISLGKNKKVEPEDAPEAHAVVARRLYHDAAYFVVNVSSPNTEGLRDLQDKGPLTDIVQAVNGVMDEMGARKPTFVKISPDLSNEAVNDVIEVVVNNGLAGIIATNTTDRSDLKAGYGEKWRDEAGGLSGNDSEFRRIATEKVAHIYREIGRKIEIIGSGGVNDTQSAIKKIQAGARVVQVVTAIREVGPSLPGRINRGLVKFMDQEGISSLEEIRGSKA